MLPPQNAGPAIRDLKQTSPTGTEAKPGLGDAIHAVTLSDRRGPRRTRADPPFWRNSLSVEAADCGAQIWLFCVPALGPLAHRCAEPVAERRAVSANLRG